MSQVKIAVDYMRRFRGEVFIPARLVRFLGLKMLPSTLERKLRELRAIGVVGAEWVEPVDGRSRYMGYMVPATKEADKNYVSRWW